MIPKNLIHRIKDLSQKSLVQGTAWLLLAKGSRIFIQAAYFILIARALGTEQYGAFAGVVALIGILTPFSSWGAENILVKHVSRNPTLFSTYWGNALLTTSISGTILLILAQILGGLVLPDEIPPALIFLVGLSDLIFLRFIDASSKSFLAVDKIKRTAQINILLSLKNMVAAIVLVQFYIQPQVLDWAILYLISTAIAAAVAVYMVSIIVGKPKPVPALIGPSMKEGFYFSIGLSSQTIYNDIDKTMLASLGTLGATGIYAAAFRIITVAFVPVQALLAAGYAKFFKHGEKGIKGSWGLAKRLIPVSVLYASLCTIGLMLFAPLIPYILGEDYREAVLAIRWLSPLLILKSVSYFAADTLTGAGFQGVRSGIQMGIAGLNCVLNLWWIPIFSWQGAAWSTLLCDGLLAALLWGVVWYYYRLQEDQEKLD